MRKTITTALSADMRRIHPATELTGAVQRAIIGTEWVSARELPPT
jgi:hypothetical protein